MRRIARPDLEFCGPNTRSTVEKVAACGSVSAFPSIAGELSGDVIVVATKFPEHSAISNLVAGANSGAFSRLVVRSGVEIGQIGELLAHIEVRQAAGGHKGDGNGHLLLLSTGYLV